MNIAVCDDDNSCVNKIVQLLEKYKVSENLKIETFSSGEEFLKNYNLNNNETKPDIIFLDIEMSDVSGIDVARSLRKDNSKAIIIFITSHISYVSDTFRLGAFQFLVKPISEKDFNCDFERAVKTYKNRHQYYQLSWKYKNAYVEYGSICYIEGYNRHLYVYTDDESYECVGLIADEEIRLKPYNFVRCHQGYLVNLSKIKEIGRNSVILSNNAKVPVSRNKKEELFEKFNLFLAGKII